LEKNATKEILAVIGLKNRPSLSKKSQGKRYYTTTTPSAGEYTMYVEIKKIGMVEETSKIALEEVADMLEIAVGVLQSLVFKILDECAKNPILCESYVQELAKSRDTRNLALESTVTIKNQFTGKLNYTPPTGLLQNIFSPDNLTELGNSTEQNDWLSYFKNIGDLTSQIEVQSTATCDTQLSIQKGKDAFLKSKRVGSAVGLSLTALSATANLLGNSSTLDASLDNARHNFSRIEEFGSFDSNESSQDRLVEHQSAKF
jgi:hypothetical protein